MDDRMNETTRRGGLKLGIAIGVIFVLAAEGLILAGTSFLGRLGGRIPFGNTSGSGSAVYAGDDGESETASPETAGETSDVLGEGEAAFNASLEKKLAEINTYIDGTFIFPVDSDHMLDEAVKGYLNGLDDPYSEYMTHEEYVDSMESSDGAYVGIGVAVQQDPDTRMITVMTVYQNSPAEEAGMQKGDILTGVDGDDITTTDLSEVVSRIRGKEGTSVTVTVYRDGQYLDFVMTRKPLNKVTVETEMLDATTGYISLTEFDAVSVEQMRTAVSELQQQGMEKMVLDLRDNPGGLLTSVVTIADDFLPAAKVFYVEDKQGNRTDYDSRAGQIFDGEMVVLINGNSASASEVLSGTLKDNQRATIVGTQSFGKGIVQTFFPLSDGSAVKLTTAHYFTPNGTDIHGVGITPDVEVEDDPETEADEMLERAKEILNETTPKAGIKYESPTEGEAF